MNYDWHLFGNKVGTLAWVGAPVKGNRRIEQVKVYVQTEGQCYYSPHAWSKLPYLKIGSVCRPGKEPEKGANEKKSPRFTIHEVHDGCWISSAEVALRKKKPQVAYRIKQQESDNNCICFSAHGVMYIIPYHAVLCAFLGDMTPLINGVLHEGIFDEWIRNETIHGNSIEVNFSDLLSAWFLSHLGIVEHLVWLRYTPQLYDWWKSIAVSYYSGKFEVQIPNLKNGELTFWGEEQEEIFFVHRMEITGAKSPFSSITWTHSAVRQKEPGALADSATHYIGRCEAAERENDTTEFAQKGIPHIDKVSTTVSFIDSPDVRKKQMEGPEGQIRKQRLPSEEKTEKVSTNEYAVGGKFRPMNTVPEVEDSCRDDISLRPEFVQFSEAIATIRELHIISADYKYQNDSLWLILDTIYDGHRVTLVEGSRDQRPCASTLIWCGEKVPLVELLNSGSWDKRRLEWYSQRRGVKSNLLRHSENRSVKRWGMLLEEKICECT